MLRRPQRFPRLFEPLEGPESQVDECGVKRGKDLVLEYNRAKALREFSQTLVEPIFNGELQQVEGDPEEDPDFQVKGDGSCHRDAQVSGLIRVANPENLPKDLYLVACAEARNYPGMRVTHVYVHPEDLVIEGVLLFQGDGWTTLVMNAKLFSQPPDRGSTRFRLEPRP